jgi:hypothetical protein
MVLALIFVSCSKKDAVIEQGSTSEQSTAQRDFSKQLANFPINSLGDLIESISEQDLADLLSKGENETWVLKKEQPNQLTITNKSATDNIAKFTFFSSDGKRLAVQQFNGQNTVTDLYEYNGESEQPWTSLALPELTLKDFIVEDAENVTDYDAASSYLTIEFAKDTMIYSINTWRLGLDADEMYQAGLEKNYIKYQHLFIWNGHGFVQKNRIDPDYVKMYSMEAAVIDDSDENDGPGPLEFTCGYGMSIKASSNLHPKDRQIIKQRTCCLRKQVPLGQKAMQAMAKANGSNLR